MTTPLRPDAPSPAATPRQIEPPKTGSYLGGMIFAVFVVAGVALGWWVGTLIGQIGVGVAMGVAAGIAVAATIDGLILQRRQRRGQT